jgi:hypothetical protein
MIEEAAVPATVLPMNLLVVDGHRIVTKFCRWKNWNAGRY